MTKEQASMGMGMVPKSSTFSSHMQELENKLSPVGFCSDDVKDINWGRVRSIKGATPVPIGRQGVASGGAHFQGTKVGPLRVPIPDPWTLFKKSFIQNVS